VYIESLALLIGGELPPTLENSWLAPASDATYGLVMYSFWLSIHYWWVPLQVRGFLWVCGTIKPITGHRLQPRHSHWLSRRPSVEHLASTNSNWKCNAIGQNQQLWPIQCGVMHLSMWALGKTNHGWEWGRTVQYGWFTLIKNGSARYKLGSNP
jgi:hypothetical protein